MMLFGILKLKLMYFKNKYINYIIFMFWRKSYKVVPIVFTIPNKSIKEENCPICLNNLKNPVHLPCGHTFHSDCILSWIDNNKNCPMCRLPLQWSFIKDN
jgi:hypothetical protein